MMSELIVMRSEANEEQAALAPPILSMRDQPAGFVSRLIAFVLDLLIMSGISALAALSVGLILSFFNLDFLVGAPSGDEDSFLRILRFMLLGAGAGFGVLLVVGYPLLFWLLTGQTPGKAFVGLRVVSLDGRPLGVRQGLRRLFGYWFSALPVFAGFFWVLIDDERRCWHDRFAGTRVVYAWDARMGRRFLEAIRERRRLLTADEQNVD